MPTIKWNRSCWLWFEAQDPKGLVACGIVGTWAAAFRYFVRFWKPQAGHFEIMPKSITFRFTMNQGTLIPRARGDAFEP